MNEMKLDNDKQLVFHELFSTLLSLSSKVRISLHAIIILISLAFLHFMWVSISVWPNDSLKEKLTTLDTSFTRPFINVEICRCFGQLEKNMCGHVVQKIYIVLIPSERKLLTGARVSLMKALLQQSGLCVADCFTYTFLGFGFLRIAHFFLVFLLFIYYKKIVLLLLIPHLTFFLR